MWWEKLLNYLIVFGSGGFFCLLAQILIIKTKLTPARILVIFLLGGIALEAIGVYDFLYRYLKAGISVPIIGFGASLAKGSISYARTYGFPGAFAGGLVRTAYGVGSAVAASYLVTLCFSPKSK